MILCLLLPIALALGEPGYGDVDRDGHPSWDERELHLWTNAARVDPEAFEAEYREGGCSLEDFSDAERTPVPPLAYSRPLNEAARAHSRDMRDNNALDHSSSDGTSFADRVGQYYGESQFIGENIAQGYGNGWNAVLRGWMCSEDGHRGNIMDPGFQELGTGVSVDFYTQDFAGGDPDTRGGLFMGLHDPKEPRGGEEVSFFVDWSGSAPGWIAVVHEGVEAELTLRWGAETSGLYAAELVLPEEASCSEYWFRAIDADGVESILPETGSYRFGAGCAPEDTWIDRQLFGPDSERPGLGCGCAYAEPAGGALAALLGLLGLSRRRDRGSARAG